MNLNLNPRGNYWTTGHIPGIPLAKSVYGAMVGRLLEGEVRLPTVVWLVSEDERLVHYFDRMACIRRLGDSDRFGEFMTDFEKVVGGSAFRGFCMHVTRGRKEILISCSVRGSREEPDIFEWKVGVVQRTENHGLSVVDADGKKEDVRTLVETILFKRKSARSLK